MSQHQRPDDSAPDGQKPETTSTRGRRRLSQRDFELEFFGGILDRDPLNADILRVHASNLAAKGLYEQALKADRRLTQLEPDRPIPWYNLTCSYALMGMTEKAFESLERALFLGYRDYSRLRRDPDLKSLRSDPRFPALLRKVD